MDFEFRNPESTWMFSNIRVTALPRFCRLVPGLSIPHSIQWLVVIKKNNINAGLYCPVFSDILVTIS